MQWRFRAMIDPLPPGFIATNAAIVRPSSVRGGDDGGAGDAGVAVSAASISPSSIR